MKNPALQPTIEPQPFAQEAASLAEIEERAILEQCNALLPGFEIPIAIIHSYAVDMLTAREAVEQDRLDRQETQAKLTEVRVEMTQAEAEIDEISRSGDRSDIAAGRAGLAIRRIEALRVEDERLTCELTKPAPSSVQQEGAWRSHCAEVKARAFARLAAELERRLIRAATEIRLNTKPSAVGERWQVSREIRDVCRGSGVF